MHFNYLNFFYRLENEKCYVVATTFLYRFICGRVWEKEELCEYYFQTPSAIHIHNEAVYTVSRHGHVRRLNTETMEMTSVHNLYFPWNTMNINKLVMFDKYSAAVPGK